MNLIREHPPERREILRRAGMSMCSELTAEGCARADALGEGRVNLATAKWWTYILHGPAKPKQRLKSEVKIESQDRSDRRRAQRAAERRRRAERTRAIRRCKCGCRKKIPPEADPRREFLNDKHRGDFHNRNGSGQPTTADTLHVSGARKPHGNAKSEGSKNEFRNSAQQELFG